MNIDHLKMSILLCRDSGITSFVWGHRGLGKSESHRTVAQANQWGFIDMRGSQLEASDLRGLPCAEDGKTRYLPPSELPHPHDDTSKCPACSEMTHEKAKEKGIRDQQYCKGILFLDEVNRSEDDVLQAIFQLVLDRSIGEYDLPEGWSVHCAGNFAKGYNTNNFKDPAFLDRFCHLSVTPGDKYTESWINWMSLNHPDSDRIIQFVSTNEDHLIGQVDGDLGFSIQPSPRSWAMVANVEDACNKNAYPSEVKHYVISGLIGSALATQFERFSCDILPKDIMDNGVEDYQEKLNGLSRNALIGLTHGLGSKCKNMDPKDRKETMMRNVCDYMLFLCKTSHRDMAVTLGRMLVGTESNLDGALLSNPKLAAIATKYMTKSKSKDMEGHSWVKMINDYDELREMMHKVSWGSN